MAKISKGQIRTLSGDNPKLRLNLKDIFGVNVSRSQGLKEALGQALLDQMIERTKSGKSRFGKSFVGYSKKYKESDDFKAAGKSNQVNLTLTGDMLGLLDFESETSNTITFGWDDSEEAAKAHGHIVGANHLPKRDFFALTKSDIAKVKSEFSSELEALKEARGAEFDEAALSLINQIRGENDGEG